MAKVRFRPSARADLQSIYLYIADQSGPDRAWQYTQRIEVACRALETMPHRGVSKPDLGDGIRTISFEGRALIAYRIDDQGVRIIRVIYAGRDYNSDDFIE